MNDTEHLPSGRIKEAATDWNAPLTEEEERHVMHCRTCLEVYEKFVDGEFDDDCAFGPGGQKLMRHRLNRSGVSNHSATFGFRLNACALTAGGILVKDKTREIDRFMRLASWQN